MSALLWLSLLLPLLLALALGSSQLRPLALILTPVATLPALVLAGFPGIEIELPWLLLGMRLGVDETGVPFLLLAGLLWTAAGIYASNYLAEDRERARFHFFFLLTFTGNLGLILALDAMSFYGFYALMTYAAYGLIAHDGSRAAHRAGKIYLILAICGEVLILTALLLMGARLGNPDLRMLDSLLVTLPEQNLIVGLMLLGFSIKMGAIPLHVWLALAHPCAPTPASAVLSGIIIKAGLIGWLRFLPLGELASPSWSNLCLSIGLLSTFYAVLVGIPQERAKTVLAYSSISQMGLITVLIGIGFAAPQAWPAILGAVLVFSLHHGLAKGALFLGVGVTAKGHQWAGWCLLLPALALVGAPFTSGVLAKLLLKDLAHLAPGGWMIWLPGLLTISSLATGLLIARFLFLAWPRAPKKPISIRLWLSWLSLLVMGLLLPWWWTESRFPEAIEKALSPHVVIEGLWPVLGTAFLAIVVWGIWRITRFRLRLPEGDILDPLIRMIKFQPLNFGTPNVHMQEWIFHPGNIERAQNLLKKGEQRLRLWSVAGVMFLLLAAGLVVLLVYR